jgi:hypothetical protein
MVDRLYNDELFQDYFRNKVRYTYKYNGVSWISKIFYTSIANLLEKSVNCSNNITYGELMALEYVFARDYAVSVFSPSFNGDISSYCYIDADTGTFVIKYRKLELQLFYLNSLFNQMGNNLNLRCYKLTNAVMDKFNLQSIEIKQYVGVY